MKFTFSLFQGLSSCQNLLFFTPYLSQNSCVKFYTEEFLQQYSHFSIPHTFSTFRSYPLIFCDKAIIVVSCKKQLKIIFLCYSKGKDYCWCFYQLFGISFLGDQFLSIDSNRWDILNAQVQNIKNYEHNWLHKKWIAQIAENCCLLHNQKDMWLNFGTWCTIWDPLQLFFLYGLPSKKA